MDMVLGHVGDERDLEERILALYAQSRGESDLAAGFDRIANELATARGLYERSRALDEAALPAGLRGVRAVLPDPVEYAADALAAAGALVERDAEGWMALLPAELACELGVGETVRLASQASDPPRDDLLICGMGAPALDRLTALREGVTAVAAARLAAEPPRPSQARALAERFVVRNAPSGVAETTPRVSSYLVSWLGWSAEADDRYDGLVRAAVCLEDGSAPDADLLELADPLVDPARFDPAPWMVEPAALRRSLDLSTARAERELEAPLAEVRTLVARRLRRDHERIADCFERLARDSRAPRRKLEPAAIEAKLAHLAAERDAKLRALGERYRLRLTIEPIALLRLDVPTLRIRLRVRRRKLSGELVLRLPAGANALDRVACAACPGATAQPVLCDDRLHALCETCAPSARGRPVCTACCREG
jgi:hypothetical protein